MEESALILKYLSSEEIAFSSLHQLSLLAAWKRLFSERFSRLEKLIGVTNGSKAKTRFHESDPIGVSTPMYEEFLKQKKCP